MQGERCRGVSRGGRAERDIFPADSHQRRAAARQQVQLSFFRHHRLPKPRSTPKASPIVSSMSCSTRVRLPRLPRSSPERYSTKYRARGIAGGEATRAEVAQPRELRLTSHRGFLQRTWPERWNLCFSSLCMCLRSLYLPPSSGDDTPVVVQPRGDPLSSSVGVLPPPQRHHLHR